MELTPQQERKLKKLAKFTDNSTLATLEEFDNLEGKVDELATQIATVAVTTKDSINTISEELKKKLESELVLEINKEELKGDKGDKGDNGIDGKDGRDGKDGKDGLNGKDGKDGIDGIDGRDGKDGSPDTGEQIIDKVNADESDKKISASKIEGIVSYTDEIKTLQNRTQLLNQITGGIDKRVTTLERNPTGSGLTNPVDYIQFNTSATPQTITPGLMQWNASDGTLDLGLLGGTVNLQLGQEQVTRVKNDEGSQINNGQVVYVSGADGTNVLVKLADADTTSAHSVIGLATENIAINGFGYITLFGRVRDLNTNAYTAGTTLYLSQTPGAWTNTVPPAPAHTVKLGTVVRQNTNNGEILVNVQNGYDLGQLDDVYNLSLTNGDLLQYVTANNRWENKSPTTALGSTFLTLDQTSAQTITASPIFNWGTSTRVPYYDANKKLTDTSDFTYNATGKFIALGGNNKFGGTNLVGGFWSTADTPTAGNGVLVYDNGNVIYRAYSSSYSHYWDLGGSRYMTLNSTALLLMDVLQVTQTTSNPVCTLTSAADSTQPFISFIGQDDLSTTTYNISQVGTGLDSSTNAVEAPDATLWNLKKMIKVYVDDAMSGGVYLWIPAYEYIGGGGSS